jgi:hypothetical protein
MNIKAVIIFYIHLLINKISIFFPKKENNNYIVLKNYFDKNYNLIDSESLGKCYGDYISTKYNNYTVSGSCLNLSDTQSDDPTKLINFYKTDYKFSLPINKEVLNQLNLCID